MEKSNETLIFKLTKSQKESLLNEAKKSSVTVGSLIRSKIFKDANLVYRTYSN